MTSGSQIFSQPIVLGVCQNFYIIAKYLNAGLGLDWAGHVRASEFSFAVNICSMATDENFGGELPMGSK